MLNLGIHKLPTELQQLYNFDQKTEDFYLDIEFTGIDSDHLSYLVPNHKRQFVAFAIDGTGSIIAYWLYNNKITIDQAPIVYLDSEGGGTVVGSSTAEFLSLLPCNTSFFSRAASHWSRWKEAPERIVPPAQRYTREYYEARFKYLADSYPCYTEFRSWLSEEMKIQPAENPFEVIVKNIEAYPSLPFSE